MNKQKKTKNKNLKIQCRNLPGFILNKKRIFIILIFTAIALTALGLMATTINTKSVASDAGSTYTARLGDLTVTVAEGGSIRARNSIEYKCQVERRSQTMILKIVPAGTYVTQQDVDNGMVLIDLDSSTLKDDLSRQEMELSGDEESYTAAKEGYQIRVKQNESDIADAEMRVRFANMDLQKYLGSEISERLIRDVNQASNLSEYIAPIIGKVRDDPNVLLGSAASQQLKRLQDDIVLARGNLANAEATLAGTIKLHDSNYVSDLDLERDKLTVMNRRFSAESSEVALDLFLRYDLPKDAEQYLSNYIETRRSLDRTYAECRSRLAQAQATLSMAEQRLKRQQEYVDDLNKQIEYCTIKAKAPGLVIYGEGGSGDMFRAMRGRGTTSGIIAEGEQVSEGQTLISMPNTAEMVAEIGVHETEVDKVRLGQPATIVMDAFPDTILRGKVIEVAPLPDEQRGWLNPDLKVYKTLVLIEGTHDFLRTRMSCRVTVFVEQLKNVLTVPIQVVANRGGGKVCYVMTPNGPEERQVKTGIFNDMFVQIASGLEEGENVMMNPPLFSGPSSEVAMSAEQQELLASAAQNQSQSGLNPAVEVESADQRRTGRQRGQMGMGMAMPDINDMPAEMIDRVMSMMSQNNPEKHQELVKLRSEDEAKFKAELQKEMQNAMRRFQQGGFQQGGSPPGQDGQQQRRSRRQDGQQQESQSRSDTDNQG